MESFNRIYLNTISALLNTGHYVTANTSLSIGSNRDYYELLNYSFNIDEPKNRLINADIKVFNIYRALGRFVWLMRGSNLVSEIAYYDSNIKNFSDDGIIVPGSSFGNRIFDSQGIDQFQNVVRILSKDPSSRRAAISVFQPNDNNRESKDIPCLFGLFFHIRENRLHSTVIMRSNNALRLLPYNLFELSLIAEIMACELGVKPGPLHFQALSMHLYVDDKTQYDQFIENKSSLESYELVDMEMSEESQLQHLQLLFKLEKNLRLHTSEQVLSDFATNKETYKKQLTEKWFQFYLVLLDFHLIKNNLQHKRTEIHDLIVEPYYHYLWD
jgi:thymidylate synthase